MTIAKLNSKTPKAVAEKIFAPKPKQQILIIGGGYAGFYTAWKLEKVLGKNEAEITLVDPLPYMTYQPFLPEVAAGSIEPPRYRLAPSAFEEDHAYCRKHDQGEPQAKKGNG